MEKDIVKTSVINIFLDTNVFYSEKFDFNSPRLEEISSLAKNNDISLYIDKIVEQEVRANIVKNVTTFISEIKTAVNKARKNFKIEAINELEVAIPYSDLKDEKLIEKKTEIALSDFRRYIKDSNISIIDYSRENVEQIFEKYFSCEPPFSQSNEKKNEFPDAFMLNNIACRFKDDGCIVVSNDLDVLKSSGFSDKIKVVENIDKCLDILCEDYLLEKSEALFEKFEELLLESEFVYKLNTNIFNDLSKFDYYIRSSDSIDESMNVCMEGIPNIELRSVRIIDFDAMSEFNNEVSFNCTIAVSVDAIFTVVDYTQSPWDSESGEYVYLHKTEIYEEHEINAYVEVIFDKKEFKNSPIEANVCTKILWVNDLTHENTISSKYVSDN